MHGLDLFTREAWNIINTRHQEPNEDTKRLDWIEATKRNLIKMHQPNKWMATTLGNPNTGIGDTARTAIDNAMKQSVKE